MIMRRSHITKLREYLGLNKKQFAELMGVSAGIVTNWEKGPTKPKPEREERLRAMMIERGIIKGE